jgi:muramoyltetrapeptide carboxypeptidase
MIIPDFLKPNDKIAITAPAGRVSLDDVKKSIDIFESWGLNVIVGETVGANFYKFSAPKEKRLEELQNFMDNPDMKAIICARGGYGLIQILDKIKLEKFLTFPKWISGLSDITNLHAVLNKNEIASIHGFMPVSFSKKDAETSIQSLKNSLFGKTDSLTFESSANNAEGEDSGILVGGNLSILYSLLGTPFDIETKDKILFIEDIGEHHYHIDRILNSFRLAEKFKGLKGLIVGGFNNIKDSSEEFGSTIEEIILESVKDYNFPVAFNFQAGHINPNISFYLGRKIKFTVNTDLVTINYI